MNYNSIKMEYQNIESTPSKPTKFRTKNWVEINDKSRGKNNNNSHFNVKLKFM